MSDAWASRGTVWLDGKHYHIKDLLGSDSMDGVRVVELALVAMTNETDPPDEDDEWGYGPNGEIVDLR